MLFSIKYTTWDRRKCSLFTVEGCSPKTSRAISPIVKYTEKWDREKVYTIKGCSLIRGVHYERFHCKLICISGHVAVYMSDVWFSRQWKSLQVARD